MVFRRLSFLFLSITIITASCTTTGSITNSSPAPDSYAVYPQLPSPDHSGMWLLPQIQGDVFSMMRSRGLQLTEDDLYHPEKPSLNQAIVRLNVGEGGGGTGSFISEKGLILTNHHVAYDAIASASSVDDNILKNGFYAGSIDEERLALDYSIYIPIEQTDVSDLIQKNIPENISAVERNQVQQQVAQFIAEQRRDNNPNLMVEVDDYWSGNRQYMVVYQIVRDIRIVYAPPHDIGKFGGDIDNWMWPRHTGDFAMLRAYIAPDGSARDYHPENIPFNPDKYLPVRVSELKPGDFTMILGFPGTTYRSESSYAFSFYENYQFQSLINVFNASLAGLEYAAANNSEAAVANASERASVANSLKYFEGIRDGFSEYNITQLKKENDLRFDTWVKADSLRNIKYGHVLSQLEQSYKIASAMGDVLFTSYYGFQYSEILQMATFFNDLYDEEEPAENTAEEREIMITIFTQYLNELNLDAEIVTLNHILYALATLPEERRPMVFYSFFENETPDELRSEITAFLERQKETSVVLNAERAEAFISAEPAITAPDSIFTLSAEILQAFEVSRENYIQHFRYLIPAQKLYVEGMIEMDNDPNRYADANFTLRLTDGQILGYSPADGVYNTPFTTFSGMLKKHTGEEPFNVPESLLNYRSTSTNPFHGYADSKGNLILNFLSTNDITGGNSGSPVLNSAGEVIGLAFDGNIEGIISDYFVVPEISRTISVDARYILFVMDAIDKTGRLLEEMDIRR